MEKLDRTMEAINTVLRRMRALSGELQSSAYGAGYAEALEHLKNELYPEVDATGYVTVKVRFKGIQENLEEALTCIEDDICDVLMEYFDDQIEFVSAKHETIEVVNA